MLSSINPRDVLPINFPIPTFKKLVYFIAYVFSHYLYVIIEILIFRLRSFLSLPTR